MSAGKGFSCAAVDDNVDIYIKKYFTNDTWMVVKDVIQLKSDNMN